MAKLPVLFAILAACLAPLGVSQTVERTFDSGGVQINYASAGEGEAVVLIHGWMSDATMWGRDPKGNPRLDTTGMDGFRIIAMDCRGHGKSGKLYDPKRYGAEMAKDVVRLLDHLKIRKAHLVGYSMGAFIAGKVAAEHPDRVRSVVYGGQAPILAVSKPSETSEVEIFAKAVEDGNPGAYLIAFSPPDRPRPTLQQANAYAAFLYKGKDLKPFIAAGRSFGGLLVKAKDLTKGNVPSLFLYGSKEWDSTKDAIALARKALPRSSEVVVEGSDHVTTLAKPAFGKALVDFVKAHKGK